jgi:metallo-beta-lactamase family protein
MNPCGGMIRMNRMDRKVHQLTGYSAHADQKGLLEWVEAMPEKPGRIKLVHGEIKAQKALEKKIEGLATDPH